MPIHFEHLWEEAEILQKEEISASSIENIVQEIIYQLNIYIKINSLPDNSEAKSLLFGKILLLITQLSAKDNINVFSSLLKEIEELRNLL